MRDAHWELIRKLAAGEVVFPPPVALIVDSPWIPGYTGVSTIDYLTIPEIWLEANLKVMRDFPDIIFLPGFWVELGMAAEPSAFGCRVQFFADKTPNVHPRYKNIEDLAGIKVPNPRTDGLLPLILSQYRYLEPRVKDAGYHIKVVAARGPFATAGHVMGISEFLMSLKLKPRQAHEVISMLTRFTIQWLQAQAESLSEVEGIMLLDDIVGFISEKDYLEFAHPYYKEIFESFPGAVKMFHDDMDNMAPYPYLQDWGLDIFNHTHLFDLPSVREKVGANLCLMGNVPPLDVLVKGTREQVYQSAMMCLNAAVNNGPLLLSAGGGVSPGTPAENIRALVYASRSAGGDDGIKEVKDV